MVPCRRSGYPVANGEITAPGGEAPRHGPVHGARQTARRDRLRRATKERRDARARKLAVILHANVVGSTALGVPVYEALSVRFPLE